MVRVKICGITNINDAEDAVKFGADAIGFVFAESPRRVSKEEASSIIRKLPPFISSVALFVNEKIARVRDICQYCNIHTIQFHGNETQDYIDQFTEFKIIKAIRVRNEADLSQLGDFKADAYLIDSYSKGKMGGTGTSFDWKIIKNASNSGKGSIKSKKIIIAGGLNPDNVAEAIGLTEPFAVDTSSGVESSPGTKDRELIHSFIKNTKRFTKSY